MAEKKLDPAQTKRFRLPNEITAVISALQLSCDEVASR
jgi:hypothetical protein